MAKLSSAAVRFCLECSRTRLCRHHGACHMDRTTRPYILAWVMALLFYVLEYSTRSAPGVMIPQLEQEFGTNGVGIGSILGSYYYTYSITSLVAGLTLDRFGAKYVVPTGSWIPRVGCLRFLFGSSGT